MTNSLLLAVAIPFLLYVAERVIHNLVLSPLRKIPGPKLAAITPLWLKWYVMSGQRVFVIHALHEKYGPIVRVGPAEIVISDITASKEIHSVSSQYHKSEWYQMFVDQHDTTNNNITLFAMSDPTAARERRKILSSGFTVTHLAEVEPIVREKVELMMTKVRRDLETGKTVNIMQWFTLMTLDVVGELAFGQSFKALEEEKKTSFFKDLDDIIILSALEAELPFPHFLRKVLRNFPLSRVRYLANARQRVRDRGQEKLDQYNDSLRPTLLTKMMEATKTEKTFTRQQVHYEAVNFIFAGSGTTTVTATYIIWAVLRHTGVKERLLNELDEMNGDIDNARLQNLPYLKAVIMETLRLYGAVQGDLPRVVPPGGRTLVAYEVPEKTVVSTQAWTLHRDPTVFPDPYKYDPSRWLNPTPDMNAHFVPWGGGARVCLGQHLAMMEMRLSVALFFRNCRAAKLAPSCTDDSMSSVNFFVVGPKGNKCEIVL